MAEPSPSFWKGKPVGLRAAELLETSESVNLGVGREGLDRTTAAFRAQVAAGPTG